MDGTLLIVSLLVVNHVTFITFLSSPAIGASNEFLHSLLRIHSVCMSVCLAQNVTKLTPLNYSLNSVLPGEWTAANRTHSFTIVGRIPLTTGPRTLTS